MVLAFGTLRYLLHGSMALVNAYLNMLDRILPVPIRPIGWFYLDHTGWLLGGLVVLGLASPWLWDVWLRWRHQAQPYTTSALGKHSPQAVQHLRKLCLTRRWAFPSLRLLPTEVPLLFSYGWLPRNGRVVVSQGLLDRLDDDEIAALYVYELGHWQGPDWPLLSVMGLLLQGFHWGYWVLARWGNQQQRLVTVAAGLLSMACYGIFWLLNKAVGWVARVRTHYRDRTAAQTTGHPNGLIRALGKLAFAQAAGVDAQGYTPPLLESLTPLLPVSPVGVLPLHVEQQRQPLARLFQWDALNPWRSWLSLNQPHPPLGDRLQLLNAYVRHWRLVPALDFSTLSLAQRRSAQLSHQEWRRLLFQGGPWSGLVIGGLVGVVLWGVGAISTAADVAFLDWLNQDFAIVRSAMLLGIGTGILLRMNAFFPDLPSPQPEAAQVQAAEFTQWTMAPDLLPGDSLPIQLSGQLLGRPGVANWLGQDLWLKTTSGLVKLHFFSTLGPIGNCLGRGPKAYQLIGQTVQVTGWFRRGQQIWIDAQQLSSPTQQLAGNHPVWSLVIFAGVAVRGLWILIFG